MDIFLCLCFDSCPPCCRISKRKIQRFWLKKNYVVLNQTTQKPLSLLPHPNHWCLPFILQRICHTTLLLRFKRTIPSFLQQEDHPLFPPTRGSCPLFSHKKIYAMPSILKSRICPLPSYKRISILPWFIIIMGKNLMKKGHINRMIVLKDSNWYHLNMITLKKRKDTSICMYHL